LRFGLFAWLFRRRFWFRHGVECAGTRKFGYTSSIIGRSRFGRVRGGMKCQWYDGSRNIFKPLLPGWIGGLVAKDSPFYPISGKSKDFISKSGIPTADWPRE